MPIIRSWALTRGFALHPGTRNRDEIRDTRTQHRPPSRQVNDHGRVSGTHRASNGRIEGTNYLLQVLRRTAHGFTNGTNFEARGILVTRSPQPVPAPFIPH